MPHRFTADGRRLVVELQNDGPVGVAGLHAVTLATGGSQGLMPSGNVNRPRAYSVHDTASRVAWLRLDPTMAQRRYAFVHDTATGNEKRADRWATNVNGNTTRFALAGNGQHVAPRCSSANPLSLPRWTAPSQL